MWWSIKIFYKKTIFCRPSFWVCKQFSWHYFYCHFFVFHIEVEASHIEVEASHIEAEASHSMVEASHDMVEASQIAVEASHHPCWWSMLVGLSFQNWKTNQVPIWFGKQFFHMSFKKKNFPIVFCLFLLSSLCCRISKMYWG